MLYIDLDDVCDMLKYVFRNYISRYDGNVVLMIQKIMARLSSIIHEYKKKIRTNDDSENLHDIPFGSTYQNLLKQNDGYDLISLLLHADGISITNSTKLKLWLLSGSIIEAPPKLRSCRRNMIIISIWIGYVEPPAHLWLTHSVNKLKRIKEKGVCILLFMRFILKKFSALFVLNLLSITLVIYL